MVAMTMDAASQVRIARSCNQVGFHPKWAAYPLGVGNESQFFGEASLGGTYVPLNTFGWMSKATPAERYWQQVRAKYIPGAVSGDSASLAWAAGALLVAAGSGLSADNPSTQQLLDTLYAFKGQSFTTLGGLTSPLTFVKDGLPKIPYCLLYAVSNAKNDGWQESTSKFACTKLVASNDPQAKG